MTINIKAILQQSRDKANMEYEVSVSRLYIDTMINPLYIKAEYVKRIKKAYLKQLATVPKSLINPFNVDGKTRLRILDGHHRYAALLLANSEGETVDNRLIFRNIEDD